MNYIKHTIARARILNAMKTRSVVTIFFLLASCGKGGIQYDASGTFEATEVMVSAEAIGKIVHLEVVEGLQVKAVETIGLIDSVQLSLKKQQLEASIQAMQARRPEVQKQIAGIQQQIATAKIESKRVQNLIEAKAANQKQLDDINAQIAVLEKQLTAQKSSLDISNRGITEDVAGLKIQMAQVEDQIHKCQIASPIDGTILVKYAEAGELANVGRALFKVADMENLYLRAYVTSEQLSQLELGQIVAVFADFGETTREYEGKISWISDKSEFTPKTIQTKDERANLVYAVKVAVKNDGYLKIGMYGQLQIKSEK